MNKKKCIDLLGASVLVWEKRKRVMEGLEEPCGVGLV